MQNNWSVCTGDEVAWVAPHGASDGVYVPFLNQPAELNQLLSLGALEHRLLCLHSWVAVGRFL